MPHILRNNTLELHIDHPLEGYNFSRFDWTGKIVKVLFKGIPISTIERTDLEDSSNFGKGFYNEFGLETAIGFNDTEIGDWFHKIGVGLLKKEDEDYLFSRAYKTRPATFHILPEPEKMTIRCFSETAHGFAYEYFKIIELHESGFISKYHLKNTGDKDIVTSEYNHNFTALNADSMGNNYKLKLPFPMYSDEFSAAINPENAIDIRQNNITLNKTPKDPFFYSHLNGNKMVKAHWELHNTKYNLGISETGDFEAKKVNLWGWSHVISPELFFDINLKPGEEVKWSRKYEIFKLNLA